MSAHCNECGTDLVYGRGENWQIMTCPVCTLRAELAQLEARNALARGLLLEHAASLDSESFISEVLAALGEETA